MSTEAVLRSLPADQLRDSVTRLIAQRLMTMSLPSSSKRASTRNPKKEPDSEIIFNGIKYALDFKTQTVTGAQLLEAVDAAIGELFGDKSQLLVLRNADAELGPVIKAVIEQVPEAVRVRRRALSEQHIDALADIYMASDPLSAALPDIERDNAEAQARFVQRWPVLTAEQIAERAGHESTNKSATAHRWKAAGRIFGVRVGRREVYPAFQFREGLPHPAIARILGALPKDMSGWQTAFWFVGPNTFLNDASPVETLGDEEAVIEAAANEEQRWMG
ncbi:hypothetical protein [Pararhizobium sp. A13]|uniref:hypothetical protein n=1 Tax=Pararhizobium sp. A13 TaxID=3133975 RepID=UPI0032559919